MFYIAVKPELWFYCTDCKAHTVSVLHDDCVTVEFFCYLVDVWLTHTYVNIS